MFVDNSDDNDSKEEENDGAKIFGTLDAILHHYDKIGMRMKQLHMDNQFKTLFELLLCCRLN